MYRVMLIDDDQAIRDHLKEIVPWERLELKLAAEAAEGEEAMAAFVQEEPHIVITDINIPLIDGLELAHRFLEKERDTQLILITGYGFLDYAREAIKAGTVDFLLKPLETGELIDALEKAIGNIQRKTEEMAKLRRMEEVAEKMLMRVRDKLQAYSRYDFQAGAGGIVDGLKLLGDCFRGAVQALDYSGIYGRNHVTVIDNILVLEEQEPVHPEREAAEVVRCANAEGLPDFRKAVGNYMNRLMIAARGSFSCVQKECVKLLSEILTSSPEIRWDTERCFAEDPYLTLLNCREPLELQALLLDVWESMREYRQRQSRKKGKRVRLPRYSAPGEKR